MVQYFNCETISLKKGSKGEEVKLLQTYLKKFGYYTYYNGHYLKIDGDYGTYTAWAVRKFQRDTGHDDDGWFGPKTCPSLNQMIAKDEGVTVEQAAAAAAQSTSSSSGTSSSKYLIDTRKNILSEKDSNLHIQGLHFLMTSFTFDTPSNTGDVKTVELLDGKFKPYLGHDVQRAYTVETEMTLAEFRQLEPELVKMERQSCYVVCPYFRAGQFHVKYTPALKNVRYIRLTLKLTEDYT